MKATGATPADQARSLGLVVGDTIEGRGRDHAVRLTLLWIGSELVVWRYASRMDFEPWRDYGEDSDWDLERYDWTKVEVQR